MIQGLEQQKIFKDREKTIFRQDILKFFDFNLEIIQAPGPPVNQYEAGTLFYNGSDQKLYLATNYKILNTPDLLWFKFNGNAQDFSTGARYDGTITSSLFTTGKYGTAIILDAIDDKVEIPANMGFVMNNDWTISMWIKITAGGIANDRIYLLERYKDANEYFYIYLNQTAGGHYNLICKYDNGGGEQTITLATTIILLADVGDWAHIVISQDTSANITQYIRSDGYLQDSGADLPDAVSFLGTETYNMGYSNKTTSFGDVVAYIDDFKIYSAYNQLDNGTGDGIGKFLDSAKVFSLNLDKINWSSYTGKVVAAI